MTSLLTIDGETKDCLERAPAGWSRDDLYKEAKKRKLAVKSNMKKDQLCSLLTGSKIVVSEKKEEKKKKIVRERAANIKAFTVNKLETRVGDTYYILVKDSSNHFIVYNLHTRQKIARYKFPVQYLECISNSGSSLNSGEERKKDKILFSARGIIDIYDLSDPNKSKLILTFKPTEKSDTSSVTKVSYINNDIIIYDNNGVYIISEKQFPFSGRDDRITIEKKSEFYIARIVMKSMPVLKNRLITIYKGVYRLIYTTKKDRRSSVINVWNLNSNFLEGTIDANDRPTLLELETVRNKILVSPGSLNSYYLQFPDKPEEKLVTIATGLTNITDLLYNNQRSVFKSGLVQMYYYKGSLEASESKDQSSQESKDESSSEKVKLPIPFTIQKEGMVLTGGWNDPRVDPITFRFLSNDPNDTKMIFSYHRLDPVDYTISYSGIGIVDLKDIEENGRLEMTEVRETVEGKRAHSKVNYCICRFDTKDELVKKIPLHRNLALIIAKFVYGPL